MPTETSLLYLYVHYIHCAKLSSRYIDASSMVASTSDGQDTESTLKRKTSTYTDSSGSKQGAESSQCDTGQVRLDPTTGQPDTLPYRLLHQTCRYHNGRKYPSHFSTLGAYTFVLLTWSAQSLRSRIYGGTRLTA